MRVLFTGGGTGGHIYPGLAMAAAVKKTDNPSILFVGSTRGMERELVPRAGFDLKTITVTGLQRRLSLQTLVTFLKLGKGLCQSYAIIKKFRPDVVVGTGGYVSLPIVFIASLLKIPTLIHEQNVLPGIANRFLARYATITAISYEESRRYFPRARRIVVTGNPVRPEILRLTREEGRRLLGIEPGKQLLLVFGGSVGARPINEAMLGVIPILREQPQLLVYYITGKKEFSYVCSRLGIGIGEQLPGNIIIKPYLHDMPAALAAADLVVSRAGATTIAELTARGIPAILIPSPYVTANHQEYNARLLEEEGAAVLITEKELSSKVLAGLVLDLLKDPLRLKKMATKGMAIGRHEAGEILLHLLESMVDDSR